MGQAVTKHEKFWEACGFGRPHIVRQMIQDGINVNWRSYTHDCCPIHVASQGKPEIVKLLLEAKCDVHVTDIRDNTALHHAAMKGHAAIMETLIKAGIDPDAQDKNGWTALHNAAYWCHPEAVEVLVKYGCNIHLTNKDNRTALHETARSKEADDVKLGQIAKCLITAGSNINVKGCDLGGVDFSALMFSAYHGHPEVATRLLEAGCKVNASGSNGWTALHWAVDREQEEVVYILLDANADPNRKGTRGEMASDRAKSDDLKEILLNAANMYRELQKECPSSPGRLSRISYTSMTSLNHSPTKTGPHGLIEENQFSPPRTPQKHSDLSDLIDKINQKSNKIQGVSRHDKDGRKQEPIQEEKDDSSKEEKLESKDNSSQDDDSESKEDNNVTNGQYEEKQSEESEIEKSDTERKVPQEIPQICIESDGSEEILILEKVAAIDVSAAEDSEQAPQPSASNQENAVSSDSESTISNDSQVMQDDVKVTAAADQDIASTVESDDAAKKIQTTI